MILYLAILHYMNLGSAPVAAPWLRPGSPVAAPAEWTCRPEHIPALFSGPSELRPTSQNHPWGKMNQKAAGEWSSFDMLNWKIFRLFYDVLWCFMMFYDVLWCFMETNIVDMYLIDICHVAIKTGREAGQVVPNKSYHEWIRNYVGPKEQQICRIQWWVYVAIWHL